MPPKTERFELRLDEQTLLRIDEWRARQSDIPTRAEAMRRLVEAGLAPPETVKFDSGDRLIVSMLCNITRHLKIDLTNTDLIESALYGGHLWGLKLEMPGLFHRHEDDPQKVDFVIDVLDMYDFIEGGYDALSAEDKALVHKASLWHRFLGFDGNNESELMGIARFMVDDLERFRRFKGRDFNSHVPTVAEYRRMLLAFEPLRKTLVGIKLNAAQILAICGPRPDARASSGA
jgi:uncharacterized protein YfbU (UPF0304 family)